MIHPNLPSTRMISCTCSRRLSCVALLEWRTDDVQTNAPFDRVSAFYLYCLCIILSRIFILYISFFLLGVLLRPTNQTVGRIRGGEQLNEWSMAAVSSES